jgi:hypothetical protein
MTMKISKGKYVDQFAIGVTWLRYPNVTWSVIFDLGLWYVEVSNELNEVYTGNPYGLANTLVCDRCGSPKDVHSHFNEKLEFELVCAECLRYDDYMNSLREVKPKVDKTKRKVKSKFDKKQKQ